MRIDDLTDNKLEEVDSVVGLDVGISSLVTLSTGEKIANPKGFNKHHQKLSKAQKVLSRYKKNSRNRDKAKLEVARIHAIISDSRKDHLHKLTTRLVRENRQSTWREPPGRKWRLRQTIVVEDLAVVNMVKNPKLARSISDATWGELIRQLDYKCQWYGRTLVKIDRWFPSSKRCGHCGHVVDKLPLSIREWTCPKCGTVHDRDINAAKNILAAGLAVLAGNSEDVCESSISPNRHSSKGQMRKTRKGKKQKLKS